MNHLKNCTSFKTLFDGLDFGSLRSPRHYAWCVPVDAVDLEEEILKVHNNFLA